MSDIKTPTREEIREMGLSARQQASEFLDETFGEVKDIRELSDAAFKVRVMAVHMLAHNAFNEIANTKNSKAFVLGLLMDEIRSELEFIERHHEKGNTKKVDFTHQGAKDYAIREGD